MKKGGKDQIAGNTYPDLVVDERRASPSPCAAMSSVVALRAVLCLMLLRWTSSRSYLAL